MAKITLIDNYDSFTYNLVHYLGELGSDVMVYRNDVRSVEEILAEKPAAIVISPGPCTPDDAGISLELIEKAPRTLPILGVCLGHQSIGQAFGGKVIRAPQLMHGKLSQIHHKGEGIFKDLPDPFEATRYHSLIVERDSLPDCLHITAETNDGLIMALQHKEFPIHGVQFHPESIASEHGHKLLANFLQLAGIKTKTPPKFSFKRPAIAVV
jgi:anthranilate synthase component II